MVWVNSFSDDDLPAATINYEFLAADSASVALSVIQGAYITRRYLLGGHEAEYQFKIIARIKPGGSNDKRLKADAVLNRFGAGRPEERNERRSAAFDHQAGGHGGAGTGQPRAHQCEPRCGW